MIFTSSRLARWWPLAVLCIVALEGCAGGQSAYREGKELAENGHSKEALEKFEIAIKQDSGSAQYRIAAIQAREALVSDALSTAYKAMTAQRYDDMCITLKKFLAATQDEQGKSTARQLIQNAEDSINPNCRP